MKTETSDLPQNIESRLGVAVRACLRGGGVDSVVVIAYSPTGHYTLSANGSDEAIAARLRHIADSLDPASRDALKLRVAEAVREACLGSIDPATRYVEGKGDVFQWGPEGLDLAAIVAGVE